MKLIDLYSNWFLTTGTLPGAVFADLSNQADLLEIVLPWGNLESTAHILDAEYIGNVSGNKESSPLIDKMFDLRSMSNSSARQTLASVLIEMFFDKWVKAFATLNFEYNPIENYAMLEVMTDDNRKRFYGKTSTRTDNLTSRNAGTTRNDPDITETDSGNIYGFNTTATDGDPADKRTRSRTGSDVNTVDVSTINTGTQGVVDGGSDREEHSYTLSRTGNIGTVTAQDMIEQERQILMWDYFYKVVFPDIDRVLTLPIY